MTFQQAMKDRSIGMIRKPDWNLLAKLELPPVINGERGAWCKLHDPMASPDKTFELLVVEFSGDVSDDWETSTL